MIQLKRANRKPASSTIGQCLSAFDSLMKRTDIGFFQLPERQQPWSISSEHAEVLKGQYDQFVFVGIGGSSLGGKALTHAMQYSFPAEKISFIENIDYLTISKFLNECENFKRTHWVFVSKSGSTLETLSMANQINDYLQAKAIHLSEHCTVISELKESPLTNWAKTQSVVVLPIDLDVGGRFSVLTPVGLLPAACMGIDLEKIRSGARWALRQRDLVATLSAHVLESFDREEFITQFWFYSDGMKIFGEWIQQLWAESLAKKLTIDGQKAPRVSSPMGCVGAIDQHSVLQQVMEGARDKMIWLSRVQSVESNGKPVSNMFSDFKYLEGKSIGQVLNAEVSGMYAAYESENISVLEMYWQDLSPQTMGAGFMLFELMIGSLGEALNVNAFDQPGVELGKKLAKNILLPN